MPAKPSPAQAAKEFVRLVFEEYWPDCFDIDGADIQAMGVKAGIFSESKYDPKKHGESDYAEPGDTWYTLRRGIKRPSSRKPRKGRYGADQAAPAFRR